MKILYAMLIALIILPIEVNANRFGRIYDSTSTTELTKLAEQDVVRAQQELAIRYNLGWFGEKESKANDALAIKWYTAAAKQGDHQSQFDLGLILASLDFMNKQPKSEENYKKGIYWLEKASHSKQKNIKHNANKYLKFAKKDFNEFLANQGSVATKKVENNSLKRVVSNRQGHSHAGRSHDHPLPKQGVKHRHGSGAYGIVTSGNVASNNKPQSGNQTVASTSRKNIIITHGKDKISLDSKYVLRDQHGCRHLTDVKKNRKISVIWHGQCKGGYASGAGRRMWYYLGEKKPYNWEVTTYNPLDERTKIFNYAVRLHNSKISERKSAQKEAERKAKYLIIDKDLIKFARKYKFNSDVSASWYPSDSAKSNSGVNGRGTIKLNLKRSHEATAKITGDYKNGRLIGSAKLKIYASKCYKKGWIFCKVSEDDTSTRSITPSSNIKKYVNTAIDNMLPGMYRRASSEISRLNNNRSSSYSSSSSNTYTSCFSGDKCHVVIRKNSKTSFDIRCTKGQVGKEGKLCVDNDGDWSWGCSLGSYHHRSARIAGQKFCN